MSTRATDRFVDVDKLRNNLSQNAIPQPLYRITEFLADPSPQIRAHWFSRHNFDFPTGLRAEFPDSQVTGSLVFTRDWSRNG